MRRKARECLRCSVPLTCTLLCCVLLSAHLSRAENRDLMGNNISNLLEKERVERKLKRWNGDACEGSVFVRQLSFSHLFTLNSRYLARSFCSSAHSASANDESTWKHQLSRLKISQVVAWSTCAPDKITRLHGSLTFPYLICKDRERALHPLCFMCPRYDVDRKPSEKEQSGPGGLKKGWTKYWLCKCAGGNHDKEPTGLSRWRIMLFIQHALSAWKCEKWRDSFFIPIAEVHDIWLIWMKCDVWSSRCFAW